MVIKQNAFYRMMAQMFACVVGASAAGKSLLSALAGLGLLTHNQYASAVSLCMNELLHAQGWLAGRSLLGRVSEVNNLRSPWHIDIYPTASHILSPGSALHWILFVGGLVVGSFLVVIFIMRNRTARIRRLADKTQQQLIRELDLQKRALDEHSILAITDNKGVINYVNDKFCKMTKYSREELIGKTYRVVNSGLHPKSFYEDFWQTITSGEVWQGEMCNRTKDGDLFWVETTIVPFQDEHGNIIQFVGVHTDITRSKQIELNLRQIEQKNRALIDQTYQFIGLLDPEGRVLDANHTALAFAGASMDDVYEKFFWETPWWSHSPVMQAYIRDMVNRAAQGEAVRTEVTHQDAQERVRIVDFSIRPIRNDDGNIKWLLPEGTDITEHVNTENELKKINDKLVSTNAELEQFVYTVSHDLKSPIVTQMGYIGCLKEDLDNGNYEQLAESVDRIEKATTRLKVSVDDLLELARIGRMNTEREAVRIGPLLQEVRADLAGVLAEKKVELVIDDSMPTVVVNRRRMFEIFENLIHNAIKYGCEENGGKISIGYEKIEAETRLFIRDEGPGIAPEYHEKVFGIFQRLNPGQTEGTGIGLTIVKRIMEEIGGRVWVESTPGEGATFWLAFPASTKPSSVSVRETA